MTAKSINLAMLLVAGLATCIHGKCAESSSSPTALWVKPEESLQWKTVMSASAALTLNWPSGAASALLTIKTDGVVLVQTNITDTAAREALVIPAPLPATYEEERVLDLSIAYRDSGDKTLKAETARLGWVTGVNGNPTRIIPAASGRPWASVDRYAVLPIPEGTTAFTVDSAAQDYDAPGWWEWSGIRAGEHSLALTAPDGEYAASLRAGGSGFIFFVR